MTDREHILTALRQRVLAFAASRLSRDQAEDLCQEVLVVLHEKYPQVTDLSDLVPLSFQVLRYKMLEFRRKAIRRGEAQQVPVEESPLPDTGDDPETVAARRQRVDRLIAALDRLGARCRDLFRWKLEGKTFAEIQALMQQRSINTIYTWDYRCRRQLLDVLGGSWE